MYTLTHLCERVLVHAVDVVNVRPEAVTAATEVRQVSVRDSIVERHAVT